MSPTVFERLAQRLLRESGFSSAVVTGRTGARRNRRFGRLSDLVAELPGVLPVHAFNPAASVRPPCATSVVRWPVRARRDFSSPPARSPVTPEPGQNAMAHRRIDLIDGDQLCDLLKKNAIGGTTTERIVEDVKVEVVYFMSLEPRGNASGRWPPMSTCRSGRARSGRSCTSRSSWPRPDPCAMSSQAYDPP